LRQLFFYFIGTSVSADFRKDRNDETARVIFSLR